MFKFCTKVVPISDLRSSEKVFVRKYESIIFQETLRWMSASKSPSNVSLAIMSKKAKNRRLKTEKSILSTIWLIETI